MTPKTASITALIFAAGSFWSGLTISNNILQAAKLSTSSAVIAPSPISEEDQLKANAPAPVKTDAAVTDDLLTKAKTADDRGLIGDAEMYRYAALYCNTAEGQQFERLRPGLTKIQQCAENVEIPAKIYPQDKRKQIYQEAIAENFPGCNSLINDCI